MQNFLIGRQQELFLLTQLMESARLVTIVGPGGMGKTTLAKQILGPSDLFCDLSEAESSADLAVVIAEVLGSASSVESLVGALQAQEPCTVVLDNLEQLMAVAPAMISSWLSAAPHLRFLVTSRVPIGLRAEHRLPLSALTLPTADTPEAIEESPAGRLFLLHARRRQPRLKLDPATTSAVLAILQATGGLPLAIEITASRSQRLTDLARRLPRLLELANRDRDVPDRHRSLAVALDGTWELLTAGLQQALIALSVARGGVDIDGAEALVGSDADDLLDGLLEWSLLYQDTENHRYRMMPMVRQYATERASAAQLEAAQLTHLKHFAHFGHGCSRLLPVADQHPMSVLRSERENFMAAANHGLKTGHVALAALACSAVARSRTTDTWQSGLPERVLKESLGPRVRADLLFEGAIATYSFGHLSRATTLLNEMREIGDAIGAPRIAAWADNFLGLVQRREGDYGTARRTLERALETAEAVNDLILQGYIIANLSLIVMDAGDDIATERLLQRSLAISQAFDDTDSLARLWVNLSCNARRRGNLDESRQYHRQACALIEDPRTSREIWIGAFDTIARTEWRAGETRKALELSRQAVAHIRQCHAWAWLTRTLTLQAAILVDLGQLTEAASILPEVAELLRERPNPHYQASLHRVASKLALCHGEHEVALQEAHHSVAVTTSAAALLATADLWLATVAITTGAHAEAVEAIARISAADLSHWQQQELAQLLTLVERGVWIAPDGSWLRVHGEQIDISHRASLRGMLAELIRRQREGEPPADLEALFAAGWPAEQIGADSARNRVWVGLNQLRKLGLAEALERSDDGYSLGPTVVITSLK
ncbi:MAG: putative ATPase/tetratricopeptide (TPR) repeat protein [Myxococcota bacterium]